MNRQEREAFERAVVDVLDGAVDAAAAEALRRQADASPERRALFEQAEALWHALHSLARAENAALPRADLKEAVLAAIAAQDFPVDDPALEAPSAAAIAAAARELFVDPLDDATRAAAGELRAQSDAHRREIDAYEAIADGLQDLARDSRKACPPIELRESVLATIAGEASPSARDARPAAGKVVSFQRGRMHRGQPVQWPIVAAAAVLLMMIGGWSLFMPRDAEVPSEPVAVSPPPEPALPEPPVVTAEPSAEPETVTPLGDAFTRMAEAMPQPITRPAAVEAAAEPELSAVTLERLWAAQQDSLADPGARMAARRAFSALPTEQARALIKAPGQHPDVLAGAAASLPPAEARTALLSIREDAEPTPSLVFAQAEATHAALEDDPALPAPVDAPNLEQIITELRTLDPDNALTFYWEAIDRLQRGDLEGALALLEAAAELESAHAYSLETARSTQSALEAAGMSPDAAAAAAALSAGMSQYDLLTSLGQNLLDEALRYDALGHGEAAGQILTAAQRFGAQIEAGSPMSWEQLAGLDLQRAAIEALEGFLFHPDDLMALTNDALNLVASMESVASFIDSFNSLFRQPFDADFFAELSQLILNQGDLDIFALPQLAVPPANKQR